MDGSGHIYSFVAHHILNRVWVKNLHRGKYSAFRIFQLVVNLLLFLCMVGLMISGIMLSREVFAFLPITGGTAIARTLHHVCAYWMYTLVSVHIGQHWGMALGMMRKAAGVTAPSKARRTVLRAVALMVGVYGLYAFITRQFPQYMVNRVGFSFFDYSQPRPVFFCDYIAIMILFAGMGYYATRLCANQKKGSVH